MKYESHWKCNFVFFSINFFSFVTIIIIYYIKQIPLLFSEPFSKFLVSIFVATDAIIINIWTHILCDTDICKISVDYESKY